LIVLRKELSLNKCSIYSCSAFIVLLALLLIDKTVLEISHKISPYFRTIFLLVFYFVDANISALIKSPFHSWEKTQKMLQMTLNCEKPSFQDLIRKGLSCCSEEAELAKNEEN